MSVCISYTSYSIHSTYLIRCTSATLLLFQGTRITTRMKVLKFTESKLHRLRKTIYNRFAISTGFFFSWLYPKRRDQSWAHLHGTKIGVRLQSSLDHRRTCAEMFSKAAFSNFDKASEIRPTYGTTAHIKEIMFWLVKPRWMYESLLSFYSTKLSSYSFPLIFFCNYTQQFPFIFSKLLSLPLQPGSETF